jgi:hypothetical protein
VEARGHKEEGLTVACKVEVSRITFHPGAPCFSYIDNARFTAKIVRRAPLACSSKRIKRPSLPRA